MENSFNIVGLFIHNAESYPNKTAIWDKNGDKITFSALAQQVRQTANYFRQKGIQRGDRVLLFVPMSIDLYRNVLALFYLGATIVFVDQWSKIDRLDTCCQMANCKAFVGSWKAHLLRFFSKGIRQIPIKLGLSYSGAENDKMCQTLSEDAALITFTTGSTGTPKAALRTHGFLYEQFKALEEEIRAKPLDADMSVLPIVLLINLAVGSTSVIADFNSSKPTKIQPKRIVRQLLDHRVTRLVASPYFIKRIAEHVSEHKISLPELNDIFTGGAPVFLKEAKLYNKAFPGKNVQVLYGSTEAEPISSIAVAELASETHTFNVKQGIPVGSIFHKAQVKIIPITDKPLFDIASEDFESMQQPEGVWGEIVVSGPHVLTQYYKNEQALRANKILIDGIYWHRTGDSGYIRDERLFLTGRCNTLIPKGEDWLSTFVFENFVQSINGVEMGTILSDGNDIRAFIELTEETPSTKEHVLAELQQLPFTITTVKFQRLPRDPRHHSKIEYGKLN